MGRRLLLAAAALAFLLPALALAQTNELSGEVGPGFEIRLLRGGSPVTSLDPGSYRLEIDDRSEAHSFHLTGPGVDMFTRVEAIEKVTWQLAFVDGRYTFFCDVHPTQMRGNFTVGTPPPPPPPPPPPAPRPLTATVGPGLRIVVSARSVRRGSYRITVRDRSATENFHLVGPGVNRKTGLRFRGQVRWSVVLRAGVYRFRSDRTRALKGTLRVT